MFCENCGNKIADDSVFCDFCGHRVTEINIDNKQLDNSIEERDFFGKSFSNIKDVFSDAKSFVKEHNLSFGIILYNEKTIDNFNDFKSIFRTFLRNRCLAGIYYVPIDVNRYFNIGNNKLECEKAISIIKKIYEYIIPTYLIILGDSNIFGSCRWANECYDGDDYIDSDLPYITLDINNPWSGRSYNFNNAVRVGRIPASKEDNYLLAKLYMGNVDNFNIINEINSFGLSTESWNDLSKSIYEKIGFNNSNSKFIFSPPFEINESNRNITNKKNLLYFNVHGSNVDNYWYGEGKGQFLKAFSSDYLSLETNGYVLGTEACYGAKSVDKRSILNNALKTGCIAFLGSSKIAYGTSTRLRPSCADIVVGTFVERVYNGYTAGDAYIDGLIKLNDSEKDDAVIKTIAEFFLYGDPSIILKTNNLKKEFVVDKKSLNRTINISFPDIKGEIKMKLTSIDEKINQKLKVIINNEYPNFNNCDYKSYLSNKNDYVTVYYKDNSKYNETLRIYHDKNGDVNKVYISK